MPQEAVKEETKNPASAPSVEPDAPPAVGGDVRDDQEATQPQGEGETAALAEAEDAQGSPALTHVAGVSIDDKGRRILRHGGYAVLSGVEDGRTRITKALRRQREQLATDQGYTDFESLPTARRALAENFLRLSVALDLMWASFLKNGRLPDRAGDWWSLLERYGYRLGLDRRPKDARIIDVAADLARLNGQSAEDR